MNFMFRPSAITGALLICGAALCHAAIIPTVEQMQTLLKNRPELDEIRWKDPARGAPVKVRLVSATAQGVVVDKVLTAGLTTRTIPLSDLSGVSFAFTPVELSLHQNPDPAVVPALKVLWNARSSTMSLNGSNAAETGLALVKSLRMVNDLSSFDEASKILDQIRAQDTSEYRKGLARAEQATIDFVKVLKGGRVQDIEKMAWKITEEDNNPDAMMLATAWLCDHSFRGLKEIEAENPRWDEDDAVKPVRDRLYNLSLDLALHPSLFYGTRTAEASAGLKKAAEVYHYARQDLLAKGVLEDLASLYPDSTAAKETAAELARLKKLDADGKLSPLREEVAAEPGEEPKEEEKKDEETPAPGAPAPSKKYNVFGD